MRLCDCSVAHLSGWGSRDQGGLEGELGDGGVLTADGESQDSCLPGAGKERFLSSGGQALTGVSAKRSCGLLGALRVGDTPVSTCKKIDSLAPPSLFEVPPEAEGGSFPRSWLAY